MHLSTDIPTPPAGRLIGRVVASDFACIVDHALSETARGQGPLTERLGLGRASLSALSDIWLDGALDLGRALPEPRPTPEEDAIALLLLWRGGASSLESQWLARIIARRAQEPHHLWEDLGLPDRKALGALISRHFPRIAAANSRNMRWKKFFYRQICADQDFGLCLSPTCEACEEYADCFAPE